MNLTARASRLLVVAWAAVILGACGATDTAGTAPKPEETTVPSQEEPPPGADSQAARAAVADLAGRLDVAETAVSVVSVEAVTWRDGSLGCAKPGVMYTQALVEGSRIVLAVDEKTYEYHQGGHRVFWCEKPTQ